MSHYQSCALCGISAADVELGIIRWKEPVGRSLFTSAPRCKDRAGCRARVEAMGEPWDVRDPDHRVRR